MRTYIHTYMLYNQFLNEIHVSLWAVILLQFLTYIRALISGSDMTKDTNSDLISLNAICRRDVNLGMFNYFTFFGSV